MADFTDALTSFATTRLGWITRCVAALLAVPTHLARGRLSLGRSGVGESKAREDRPPSGRQRAVSEGRAATPALAVRVAHPPHGPDLPGETDSEKTRESESPRGRAPTAQGPEPLTSSSGAEERNQAECHDAETPRESRLSEDPKYENFFAPDPLFQRIVEAQNRERPTPGTRVVTSPDGFKLMVGEVRLGKSPTPDKLSELHECAKAVTQSFFARKYGYAPPTPKTSTDSSRNEELPEGLVFTGGPHRALFCAKCYGSVLRMRDRPGWKCPRCLRYWDQPRDTTLSGVPRRENPSKPSPGLIPGTLYCENCRFVVRIDDGVATCEGCGSRWRLRAIALRDPPKTATEAMIRATQGDDFRAIERAHPGGVTLGDQAREAVALSRQEFLNSGFADPVLAFDRGSPRPDGPKPASVAYAEMVRSVDRETLRLLAERTTRLESKLELLVRKLNRFQARLDKPKLFEHKTFGRRPDGTLGAAPVRIRGGPL